MSLGFGTVARIGHLYPSGGLCDYEMQAMAPDGVQFVVSRLPFPRTGIAEDHALIADLETHARMVADADVSMIAVNCTAAGVLVGPETINRRVTDATGLPGVTTAQAVLAALAAVGRTRLGLITPYPEAVVEAETAFLADHGYDVVVALGPSCGTAVEQAELDPQLWVELGQQAAQDGCDALLYSCAGIRISTVIDEIEQLTGLPVVTSNQALLWLILDRLGLSDRPTGYGRLLNMAASPAAAPATEAIAL